MYENFERLLELNHMTIYKFCKDTNVSESTIYTWKKKRTRCSAKLQKIVCEYFKVSADFLMYGKEQEKDPNPGLTARDNRDITKDLDRIMEKLNSKESGPATYGGEELDQEAVELFLDELEIALKRLKIINKEKYTNKRYKK